MTYIEDNDENVRTYDSPLDPWGLLTAEEKAHAATIHARLVRTPRIPYVPPPPLTDEQRRQRRLHQETYSGIVHCVFGCGYTDITHYVRAVSSDASNAYLWGPVCGRCTIAVRDSRHTYYTLAPYTAQECPNWYWAADGPNQTHAWRVTGSTAIIVTGHPDYQGEFTVRFATDTEPIVRAAQYESLLEARDRARRLQRVVRGTGHFEVSVRDAEHALLDAF